MAFGVVTMKAGHFCEITTLGANHSGGIWELKLCALQRLVMTDWFPLPLGYPPPFSEQGPGMRRVLPQAGDWLWLFEVKRLSAPPKSSCVRTIWLLSGSLVSAAALRLASLSQPGGLPAWQTSFGAVL